VFEDAYRAFLSGETEEFIRTMSLRHVTQDTQQFSWMSRLTTHKHIQINYFITGLLLVLDKHVLYSMITYNKR